MLPEGWIEKTLKNAKEIMKASSRLLPNLTGLQSLPRMVNILPQINNGNKGKGIKYGMESNTCETQSFLLIFNSFATCFLKIYTKCEYAEVEPAIQTPVILILQLTSLENSQEKQLFTFIVR